MSPARGPLTAVLDVGTSQLKAALVGADGRFAGSCAQTWGYASLPGVPGGLRFAPEELLQAVGRLMVRLGEQCGGLDRVCAVIVSAQRLGGVLLDRDGGVLEGVPNIDRRAAALCRPLAGAEYEEYYRVCGRWPGAQHMLGRMRWFAAQPGGAPVGKILSISDYLTWRLCGEMASDPTTACETACLDIGTGDWSREILDREGLDRGLFPPLVPPGTVLGRTKGPAARALGLPEGIPVCAGAGDTQLGLLGAGALSPGQQAVVAGSSAPVNQVLSGPRTDPACRTVTNPYLAPGLWVMEANAMLTGLSFAWARDLLFEEGGAEGYRRLEALARKGLAERGEEQLFVFAGASLANSRGGGLYPTGQIRFAMSDWNAGRVSRGAFAFSGFEGAALAILANRALLAQAGGEPVPEDFLMGGGETKLTLLLELLQRGSGGTLRRVEGADLTCLGGAVLALTAVGAHPSLEAACAAMVRTAPVSAPGSEALERWAASAPRRREAWVRAWRRAAQEHTEKGE